MSEHECYPCLPKDLVFPDSQDQELQFLRELMPIIKTEQYIKNGFIAVDRERDFFQSTFSSIVRSYEASICLSGHGFISDAIALLRPALEVAIRLSWTCIDTPPRVDALQHHYASHSAELAKKLRGILSDPRCDWATKELDQRILNLSPKIRMPRRIEEVVHQLSDSEKFSIPRLPGMTRYHYPREILIMHQYAHGNPMWTNSPSNEEQLILAIRDLGCRILQIAASSRGHDTAYIWMLINLYGNAFKSFSENERHIIQVFRAEFRLNTINFMKRLRDGSPILQ